MLVACPGCGQLAAYCDVMKCGFVDVRRLRESVVDANCTPCGRHAVWEFQIATDEQIRAAGFTADDYQ